jgi:hypothetical protein
MLKRARLEIDHMAKSIAFYSQYDDRGAIFTVRHRGEVVGSIDTREVDGMGTVAVPRGARFIEIDDTKRDVLFT